MGKRKRVLGLIPAKGGSQRLALKNIKKLAGRTLIEWAAEAAHQSGVIDRVVLSTEAVAVKVAAEACGIEVPFMRPEYLAKDPYGVVDVALHTLEKLEAEGDRYDYLIILLPTSPLRTSRHIQEAYELFLKENAKFLMSVSQYSHTPFSALTTDIDNTLKPLFPNYIGKKSQEMPVAYRCNGAIHILDVEAFKEKKSYYAEPLFSYVMPQESSVDIDEELDLKWAEFLLKQQVQ